VVLCSVYRPPNSTLQYLEEVTANLNTIIVNNPDTPIWIAGDFNLPNIKWSNGTISGYNYPRAFGELLLDFSNDHGLTQMVDTPTRGNNILDLFFTNRPSLVESCNTLPGISDHEIVNVSSLILAPIHTPQERKIFQWDKADLNHITEIILDFSSTFLHQFNLETPINTLWNEFKSLCDTCLATVPFKFSSTKFCPPWLTRQIKRLSRQKH